MLPFEDGGVPMPDADGVVLRARPGVYDALPKSALTCVQSFKPACDQLQAQGFRVVDDTPDDAALVIVHITRSREESLGLIAKGWSILRQGGWLIVDGDKSDGIDGIWKVLRKALPNALQDSKAHGRVIWCAKDDADLPDWQQALSQRVNPDGFVVTAGVFSADGVDPGSAALADHLGDDLKGRGADLGAGWGWLAKAALERNPGITDLDLVEAEGRALSCARENVTDPRAAFHWADATRWTGAYDFVISNPPFHVARKPDPSLGRAFIASAARMLTPKGHFWMVANRQLAYEEALERHFAVVDCVSQSNRFKVLHARKPHG